MIAVIATGGKQYLVKSGDIVMVEKLDAEPGVEVIFDQVLMTANDDGSDAKVGTPYLSGVTVTGTCAAQERTKKIRVVKFKRKVRYRRVHGHRQHVTKVTIK
ncbi:MAG: 50S ribosomal protein L21 [Patescibacteria group bacterium]